MSTLYADSLVVADTLTVGGTITTVDETGILTITGQIRSDTALATPSALTATAARWFASTVSGGVLMGFGTTNDVALLNRAGTVVLGVGPNTTAVNIAAGLTFVTSLLSDTALATPSALSATGLRSFASTVSGAALMGFGTTGDVTLKNRAGTDVVIVVANSTRTTLVGNVGIGGATGTGTMLYVTASVTASGAAATGLRVDFTPTANANSDVLRGLQIQPAAGTPGSSTGLLYRGIDIGAFSVAAYTSPGDPVGLNIGVITGTGATNAASISLGAGPTGATTNYLILATNFSVTSAGILNLATGGEYRFNGTKIAGAQGAAVSDASGGATIDAEARTAINTLLARIRTHGLIAT